MVGNYESLVREFFSRMDGQGDLFSLLTDDVEFTYPKWGVAHGKSQLGQLFQDMGQYVASIAHNPQTFRFLSDRTQLVVLGRCSGQLQDGKVWGHDNTCGGGFCTNFEFRENLICRVRVYLDPDYADQTAPFYPWRK